MVGGVSRRSISTRGAFRIPPFLAFRPSVRFAFNEAPIVSMRFWFAPDAGSRHFYFSLATIILLLATAMACRFCFT